ncbi:MAG TPA: glycosyltransferase [Actinomycetota bacterium]|nr:glycosyltransferase [Actinomycetota bacterium]
MRATIVLATHDPDPAFLRRQVASLRAQTEADWRCLVLDDASQNRSEVAGLLTDVRFHLLPPEPHLGAYRAFEHLLAACQEAVPVFLCDQDDYWRADKIDRMLTRTGAAAVFSAMRVVDERGGLVRERFLSRAPEPRALTPAGLLLMNTVSGAAMAISPEVRAAALPFPAPELRGWHDQWLAAVAARLGGVHYLDEPLVDYTRHSGQVTGDGLRRITAGGVRRYAGRLRAEGPLRELASRSGWVRRAARHLLDLPGPVDPELEALAAGRWAAPLSRGVRAGRVPVARALLLASGRLIGPMD